MDTSIIIHEPEGHMARHLGHTLRNMAITTPCISSYFSLWQSWGMKPGIFSLSLSLLYVCVCVCVYACFRVWVCVYTAVASLLTSNCLGLHLNVYSSISPEP